VANSSRNQVNLDGLIPRADLFETSDSIVADTQVIRISDLKPSVIYDMLRKPDFQRETANWSPDQVVKLVETFSTADIIPSVILWQSGSKIFIVDGAHRLSALVAWVRDDYGAGELSQKFYEGKIPDHQRQLHEKTRSMVNDLVGPWSAFEAGGSMLNLKDIQVQWIKSSRADRAADAFIRINQGGTVIDPLEVRILKAKRSALSVATRIIARAGTGHEYWKHFSEAQLKEQAPKLGAEIYRLLYTPPLEVPIKSMDVPLAGFGYGSGVLRFAFDLVGLVNDLPVPDSTRAKTAGDALPDDLTGKDTVKYLQNVKRATKLILSNDKMSLGLHPALYFYTAGGSFQPAALHNLLSWVLDLEKHGKISKFLKVRRPFENVLLSHPVVVKPAAHKLGSGARTRTKMVNILNRLLDLLSAKPNEDAAWNSLSEEFPHLASDEQDEQEAATKGIAGGKFSRGAKNAAHLVELPNVSRCGLCGGLMHRNGKVVDHKSERAAGGSSASINARWVHPVCNSNRTSSA
jgi:hypothetical protein